MPRCLEWAEERSRECTKTRKEKIKKCSEWEKKWDKQCKDWDDKCCDWWPCSWGCKLVTWVCVGWKWVSTWVCKGWYWVVNIVCVAWTWITTLVCVVWDVVTTVVNAILETLESILVWILDGLAIFVNILLSIPIIGGLLKWGKNIFLEIAWGLVGLGDTILGSLGIRPEKKLRICTIIMIDENGNPVAQTSDVVTEIQAAIDIFKEQANVRLIRSAPFQYDSGFADKETATEEWVTTRRMEPLDVECGLGAAGEDLWLPGTDFEVNSSFGCFYGKFRRLIGYGAPVVIFVVRRVEGPEKGCSIGPLTNYVTVEGRDPICIAHELGHACNLWHVGSQTNLMHEAGCGQRELDWWQIAILRNSRHVTYF